jgi:glycosyltransferase involved in cell wall biosynthesis
MSTPATILLLLKRVDCIDGIATYLETLTTGLAGLGDRVVIVSGPITTPEGSELRRAAIRAAVLDWIVIPDFRPSRPQPAQVRRILQAIREHRVDVVSPQGLSLLPLAFLVSRLAGKPSVANYHPSLTGQSPTAMATRRSLRSRLLYRAMATLFPASVFIAISRDIVEFYRADCGIPQRRIHYQVLGVDTAVYRPPAAAERAAARAALGIDADTLVCVLPGRLNLVKGHDVVVDALRLLRATRPELKVVCLFVGGGDQKEQIEAYALHDADDRRSFRFLGFINRAAALREIYWASDVLVLPSRFEGFPIVVAETMCAGCVPVRTPAGGWRDQIEDGVTGYVIPFNDPPALAAKIALLAGDGRARMREAATRFATANFSKQAMIAGTSALYREVGAGLRRAGTPG